MVIGIEAQRLFRKRKHGMDLVALELIKALQEIDKLNTYYIFVNKGPDKCLKASSNFHIVEFGGWYPVWEQLRLPGMCRKYKLELLHCTSNLAPLFISIPLILTLHDIIYLETGIFFKEGYTAYQRFGNLYRQWVAPRVCQKAKSILTVSKSEKAELSKLPGLKPQKIKVVYNAMGKHFQQPVSAAQKEAVRQEYNLPQEYAMFLGNTDPKKNTRNSILGFLQYCEKSNTELKLVVADLDAAYVEKLLKRANLSHLHDRLVLCGYIPNEDMPAIISQAKMFLYPSIRESFGIPILEAMSQGVPVITSSLFSMPEVAGGAALLIDPHNVLSIAEGIARLQEDEDLRQDLIERGYERQKQFSWTESAKQVLEVYTK